MHVRKIAANGFGDVNRVGKGPFGFPKLDNNFLVFLFTPASRSPRSLNGNMRGNSRLDLAESFPVWGKDGILLPLHIVDSGCTLRDLNNISAARPVL